MSTKEVVLFSKSTSLMDVTGDIFQKLIEKGLQHNKIVSMHVTPGLLLGGQGQTIRLMIDTKEEFKTTLFPVAQ